MEVPESNPDWPVVGHEHAVRLLRRSIVAGRISHAYLFTGPPHVGKTTLAKAFAVALNCSDPNGPCGTCRACRLIPLDRYHDVQTVAAAQETGADGEGGEASRGPKLKASISIDQVRAMQHDAALAPYEAKRKVYVVRNAEKLRIEAANSLLKTLEEPPPSVIIVLTALDASLLLPTVVSRCQQVSLRPLPTAQIENALRERSGLAADATARLARLSRGCYGWAMEAASHPRMVAAYTARLEQALSVPTQSLTQRFALAEKLAGEHSGNTQGLQDLLALWLGCWRDILLHGSRCSELSAYTDFSAGVSALARHIPPARVLNVCRDIEQTIQFIAANVNARLALEALMLKLPAVDPLASR